MLAGRTEDEATNRKAGPRLWLFLVAGLTLALSLLVYYFFPSRPRRAAELYGDYVLDCEADTRKINPSRRRNLRTNGDDQGNIRADFFQRQMDVPHTHK